jgi:hypothetical protein
MSETIEDIRQADIENHAGRLQNSGLHRRHRQGRWRFFVCALYPASSRPNFETFKSRCKRWI